MSRRLVAVIVMAVVMGLVFGGLRVASAINTANGFARTSRLAVLGVKVTALAQAMENERDITAAVLAAQTVVADKATVPASQVAMATEDLATLDPQPKKPGQPPPPGPLLRAQAATNQAAAQVRALVSQVGGSFPVNTQQRANIVAGDIVDLPGLRSEVQGQPASSAISAYSEAIAHLFQLNDEITSGSGDATLADEVRALGAMSRAKDQASQQRAILYAALIEGTFNDVGGPVALGGAVQLQTADLLTFQASATPAQVNDFINTVSGREVLTAQLMNNFMSVVTKPQSFTAAGAFANVRLGNKVVTAATAPDLWFTTMSATVDKMHTIEQQVAAGIVARSQALQQGAQRSAVLTGAVTGGTLLLVLIATLIVARSLVEPLRRLQTDALEVASVRLPTRVAELSQSSDPNVSLEVEPIGVHSTDEIGRVARAFDQVHREAVRLAGNEAMLRGNVSAMFISLSRRSVPLIERLARMIDSLEQNEDDPDRLSNLFSMDHLVTRMRRNSENLLVLAGEEPVRKWSEPVPLADVARAATSEIEQYGRVLLNIQPGIVVSGQAAADVVHLLAEIIENATMFSPRDTSVHVSAQEVTSGGVLLEVRDSGVGIPPARLSEINWRLDNPPLVDVSVSRHMGLFAVSRLAARHGVRVRLRVATPQGLSALVWLPGNLTGKESIRHIDQRSRQLAAETSVAQLKVGARSGRHSMGLAAADGHSDGTADGVREARPAASVAGASNWFRAKRPSGRGAQGTGESAALSPAAISAAALSAVESVTEAGGRGPGTPGFSAFRPPARNASGADRMPGADSWTDDGWRLTETLSPPVLGDRTTTGLPARVPGANLFPGSAGDRPSADGQETSETPAFGRHTGGYETEQPMSARRTPPPPQRRSADQARSRLSGFQLGSREAESWTSSAGEGASR